MKNPVSRHCVMPSDLLGKKMSYVVKFLLTCMQMLREPLIFALHLKSLLVLAIACPCLYFNFLEKE